MSGFAAFERYPHLMIYGKPGAGKTTLLKRVAMECATGNYRPDFVPVFITLREFAEEKGEPSLDAYIRSRWRGHAETAAILEKGLALVLLDGLDEVPDHDRVRKAIVKFTEQFHRCAIALSCRIAAQEYVFEQFTEVEVANFEDPQIQAFAEVWFGAEAEAFLKKLNDHKRARELASSPLLLIMLCLVFEERNDFGGTRAGLYKEAIEILLKRVGRQTRNRARLARWADPRGHKKPARRHRLSRIPQIRVLLRPGSAGNKIEAFFADRELLPEKLLNLVESNIGLLVERAAGVYSFSHLTFQEYLTARRVANDKTLLSEIGPHIADERWREVWLLLVTMVDADDIVLELRKQIDLLTQKDLGIQKYLEWCSRKAPSRHGGPIWQRCAHSSSISAFLATVTAISQAYSATPEPTSVAPASPATLAPPSRRRIGYLAPQSASRAPSTLMSTAPASSIPP